MGHPRIEHFDDFPRKAKRNMAEKEFRFRLKIQGKEAGVVSAITPPIDVEETFGTQGRVPVGGTINGFPFRSSLMPMGGCHMMPVNKALCDGAGAKPGDVVDVVMRRDVEERTVEAPPELQRELSRIRKRKSGGRSWHSRIRKRWPTRSIARSKRRRRSGGWRRLCRC